MGTSRKLYALSRHTILVKGFQYGGISVSAAFPLRGEVSGTTSISYEGYNQREVIVLSDAPIVQGYQACVAGH
jgi:hypothetical protein